MVCLLINAVLKGNFFNIPSYFKIEIWAKRHLWMALGVKGLKKDYKGTQTFYACFFF